MLDNILTEANDRIAAWLEENATHGSAKIIGLDYRAGPVYVTDEAVVIEKHNRRSFDCYGGGEYVDSDSRQSFGQYEIYLADDDRVMGWIEYFNEHQK